MSSGTRPGGGTGLVCLLLLPGLVLESVVSPSVLNSNTGFVAKAFDVGEAGNFLNVSCLGGGDINAVLIGGDAIPNDVSITGELRASRVLGGGDSSRYEPSNIGYRLCSSCLEGGDINADLGGGDVSPNDTSITGELRTPNAFGGGDVSPNDALITGDRRTSGAFGGGDAIPNDVSITGELRTSGALGGGDSSRYEPSNIGYRLCSSTLAGGDINADLGGVAFIPGSELTAAAGLAGSARVTSADCGAVFSNLWARSKASLADLFASAISCVGSGSLRKHLFISSEVVTFALSGGTAVSDGVAPIFREPLTA